MIPRELKVRSGDPIRPAWERLVRWVDSLRIIPSDDVTIRLTPHGTVVRVATSELFRGPLRVSHGAGQVSVSPGLVNEIVPVIRENGLKRRIDNRDAAGVTEKVKSAPRLTIDLTKASEDGRIFISIKYTRKQDTIPEEAEIVQTDSAKGPIDGLGYYPIAFLWLTQDRKDIERSFQITHHNIRATFQERALTAAELESAPEAKPIGRHIFYPA